MISVIIPVYNVRPYLAKCINSVKVQTSRNWECIIVDDGSTDGGGELADELVQGDGRFRVVHQDNRGLSAARNLGMELANGDALLFIDSDDWIERNAVATLCSEWSLNPDAGRIVGLCYEHDEERGLHLPWSITPAGMHGPESPHLFSGKDNDPGHATACLYVRKLIPDDLRFPKVKLFEDMIFNMGLLFAGVYTFISRKYIYNYMRRGDSMLSLGMTDEEAWVCRDALYFMARRYNPSPALFARCCKFLENALQGKLHWDDEKKEAK